MNGIFTISLDYELHWGVFDKRDRQARKQCYLNTLQLVPQLLDQFAKNDVHVTWATVGSMFAADSAQWLRLRPSVLPAYDNPVYSAYEWVKKNPLADEYAWAHFAPDSIRSIQDYPGQELGTHTFGHYYCIEPGQTLEAFTADLDSVLEAAKELGVSIRSLVFPRNQFNKDVLGICYQKGITAVRSNPESWFWTPVADGSSGILRKVFRTGDSYMPMGARTTYPLTSIEVKPGEPLLLPASRLLRSWHPKYSWANKLRLSRILSEMEYAAKNGECYHLWWHPENFGDYPEQNMQDLAVILNHFTDLKGKYGMTSWNMGEFSEKLHVAEAVLPVASV